MYLNKQANKQNFHQNPLFMCVYETVDNKTINEMIKQLRTESKNYEDEHFHNGAQIHIAIGSGRNEREAILECHSFVMCTNGENKQTDRQSKHIILFYRIEAKLWT